MIFQDPMTSLNPVLTIGRQIEEALEEHLGYSRRRASERAVELLESVGIPAAGERVGQYPHQFSGGMRQRAMIAMAVACQPKLLIADEPTTALDVTIQAQILDLLRRLRRELGMALILITHDLGVVAGMCDRVIVMYAGFVVEQAPTRRLFAQPSHPYTLGLLASVPRIDRDPDLDLPSIEGAPPDLAALPVGCPFQARCRFVIDRCRAELPPLLDVGPEHRTRCWVDVATGRPR
jgi:oligopeptide transport system ATP-binding protein